MTQYLKPKSIVVIGAGIVGISCGLHLQRRGHRVTLLDPRGLGNGASFGNAGVLASSECLPVATPGTLRRVPKMLLSRDGPLHIRPGYLPVILPWLVRFLAASTPQRVMQISHALVALLETAVEEHRQLAGPAGISASIRQSGWLKAYESIEAFESARPEYAAMRKQGVLCEELGPGEILAREPALAPIFKRAIFHPDCHHVGDPGVYTTALGVHLVQQGATLREEEALGFDIQNNSVVGVKTTSGVIPADAFVVACGAWSKTLAGHLGERIPLDTERGYHVMLSNSGEHRLQTPVLWTDRSVVLSQMEGGLRMTSSVEFAGLDAKPDYRTLNRLAAEVSRAVPSASTDIQSRWLGFRPSMPDSLPVIGPVRRFANCFLAFGHGHLGLTLGPITGRLMADCVEGTSPAVDLSAYSSQRFS